MRVCPGEIQLGTTYEVESRRKVRRMRITEGVLSRSTASLPANFYVLFNVHCASTSTTSLILPLTCMVLRAGCTVACRLAGSPLPHSTPMTSLAAGRRQLREYHPLAIPRPTRLIMPLCSLAPPSD